jgi:hypothetical protein
MDNLRNIEVVQQILSGLVGAKYNLLRGVISPSLKDEIEKDLAILQSESRKSLISHPELMEKILTQYAEELRELRKKVSFTCEKCKKEIQIQTDIYKKLYEHQKICLSCRQEKQTH